MYLTYAGNDGVSGFLFRNGYNMSLCGYYPMFPASSPLVTAIGGTSGGTDGNLDSQIGCSSSTGSKITSGGGFSGYYLQPTYQEKSVANYFTNTSALPPYSHASPYETQYNAYPVLSLIASDYGK